MFKSKLKKPEFFENQNFIPASKTLAKLYLFLPVEGRLFE